jgi:alkylhydroperoxidase family enzyme
MRLQPIDKPKGLMMRLAFWFSRRQFGKVMTPMRVFYPRVPKLLKVSFQIQKFEMKGLTLDMELHSLLGAHISQINGCTFCNDIARVFALREHIGMEKFDALGEYRTSPLFSERERAALAYVEEASRNRRVSDSTFDALRRRFSETEIVEITWLNAIHNYYNLLNVPLEIGSDGLCAIPGAD